MARLDSRSAATNRNSPGIIGFETFITLPSPPFFHRKRKPTGPACSSAETQLRLRQLRAVIKKNAPAAQETIAYGIPTFRLNGNLVHFGGFKEHVSFFPTGSGVAAFKKQLAAYKTSKGTIQFPIDKALPVALIARIVKFRVRQNLAKAIKPSVQPRRGAKNKSAARSY
jgi:uncharacterized protein YdhG (YjbR/CyaY superfamily)